MIGSIIQERLNISTGLFLQISLTQYIATLSTASLEIDEHIKELHAGLVSKYRMFVLRLGPKF